jgi:hypothetical protein
MKKLSGNTIFLIIASLVVAGGLYWYFFTGSPSADLPLSTALPAQSAAQTRFDTLTSELGPITFNLAILSDPRFTALVDLATPVGEEPIGVKDPFAPI